MGAARVQCFNTRYNLWNDQKKMNKKSKFCDFCIKIGFNANLQNKGGEILWNVVRCRDVRWKKKQTSINVRFVRFVIVYDVSLFFNVNIFWNNRNLYVDINGSEKLRMWLRRWLFSCQ